MAPNGSTPDRAPIASDFAADTNTTSAKLNIIAPGTASGVKRDVDAAQAVAHAKAGHPLDPLSADEILAVSFAVRHYVAAKTDFSAVRFITNYLLPPPKRTVLAYLGIPLAPGQAPEKFQGPIIRKAEVDFLDAVTGDAYNAIVALSPEALKWEVEQLVKLPIGTQPQISPGELLSCEDIIRKDERIQKLAADVGIKPEQLFADGWSIGYDDRFPKNQRIQQALMFARFSKDDNHYGHPMDFVPVIDIMTEKVIHIDFPAAWSPDKKLSVPTTQPPPLTQDTPESANRPRIPPPRVGQNFLLDLMEEDAKQAGVEYKQREAPKPLHVIQPEGVSFKMDGNVLEWQKWKMHISFGHREGIVLSTITYNDNGEERPLFYRLSLAEMVVPYGTPEHPHPRKFAFDSGEYGMGTMANELTLGCDCLGQIHYLDGAYTGHDGSAVIVKNAICIHEEDNGLLWKHSDYRVGGRSRSVRSRRLVLNMACTLANYEYIFNYIFYQDGTIELEVRLTGILQVYVGGDNEPSPYGVHVARNISAQNHQHMFSVRLDPMIDGLANSVVESDVLPSPHPTGSPENFAGNAFAVHTRTVAKASEGPRTFDAAADRRWRIVNNARKHYASGQPVGYALGIKGGVTPFLPRDDSWVGRRARFAKYPVWVVREKEDAFGGRMWPSGKYVPQARGEPADSIGRWVQDDGDASLEDEDLLVYLTVGVTHIPRPEDWPVMPVDHLRLTLKPVSFFAANPGMDVPSGKDPKSVNAFTANTPQEATSCCH